MQSNFSKTKSIWTDPELQISRKKLNEFVLETIKHGRSSAKINPHWYVTLLKQTSFTQIFN